MTTRYRSDIDGLRALAVLLVFAYHLKLSPFSGGFIGVDVFFVISGFLITGIVIKAIDRNSFSLSDFFNRRIKRIVPNVFLVASCTIIAGWFILLPKDYSSLISSYLYTSIYAANFYFWKATGAYFSSSADEMPLLHMWSLAVEEQYYFIWPIIILLALKHIKTKHIGVITLIISVFAFIFSEIMARRYAGFSYYMPITRSGGLLLGSALALMNRDYKKIREFNSYIVVILGTILIAASSVTVNKLSVFPGLNSAIPSFGAMLVILGGNGFNGNVISKIYGSKIISTIGLLSFSIYLWHWPLIAYSTYMGVIDSLEVKLTIVLLTFILSYLSLKFIENPIRKSKISFVRSFIFINTFFIATAFIVLFMSTITNGFKFRSVGENHNLDVKYAGMDEGWCHVSAEGKNGITFNESMAKCYIGDKTSNKEALYIGDSNAGHYGPFVDEMGRRAGIKINQLSTSSCYPTREVKKDGENPDVCINFRRIINEKIKSGKYDTIIIANRWARDDKNMSYKNANFTEFLSFYSSHAKKVIIMDQMPEWVINPAACYERGTCDAETNFDLAPGLDESRKKIESAASHFNNVYLVDPYYLMLKNKKYTPFAMGYPMYHDNGHLSINGMMWIAEKYLQDNKNPLED
nr:MAG TPA: putative acyltransferase [Caudoviricetes sp.]